MFNIISHWINVSKIHYEIPLHTYYNDNNNNSNNKHCDKRQVLEKVQNLVHYW